MLQSKLKKYLVKKGLDVHFWYGYIYFLTLLQSAVEKQIEKEFTMSTFDMDLDIFSRLTAQDVREIVESVAAEMLGGLQVFLIIRHIY